MGYQFLFLFMFLQYFSLAAKAGETNEDFHTWGNLTAISSLGGLNPELANLKLWLEGQGRFGEDTSRFSQGILRLGLGYSVNDYVSLWIGYAWIPTAEPFTQSAFDEHRIWQQLLWNKSFSIGGVMGRTRLEQRYVGNESDVGWRFRQFFKIIKPLPIAANFSFVVWDEIFVDINLPAWKASNGFDQNRVFAGIGYQFDPHVRMEIGYVNQYISKPTGDDAMNHIISVNMYLNY
ncbi:MAG: DUF2490 domain-containing protein [Methylococcaceae bacterium]